MSAPSTSPAVVACLGEALIDVVHRDGSVSEHVGGSLLNTASVLARLGHRTHLAAWWGPDERGRAIEAHLAEHDVCPVPGCDGAGATSTARAEVDEVGHAEYTFQLDWRLPELATLLPRVGHVHTASIGVTLEPGGSQVVEAVRAAREHASISYDPNARPAIMGEPSAVLPRIEEVIALADVVKASDEDIAWLYPGRELTEVLRGWLASGPALAVVTRGGEGALAMLRNQAAPLVVAPLSVTVGDTVGAGDSFMGGLLSGLLDAGLLGSREAAERLAEVTWDEVLPALRRAATTSGLTVERIGAHAPARHDVLQRLAQD